MYKIKDIPTSERPRERLKEVGVENLSNNELLAIILKTGTKNKNVTELSFDILKEYSNKIINVHPSLIPSFCGDGFYGLKVHEAALNYGVKVTGATVHFVNEITDGGKIIIQKAVYIKEGDTPEILQRRVMEEAEWKILPQAIKLICNGG